VFRDLAAVHAAQIFVEEAPMMFRSKIAGLAIGSLLACLASVAVASPSAESNANRPEGTWLLDVSFPPQPGGLSFKELITFHAGGTLTETNSTLNAASGVLGIPVGFGLVGSDGQGTWSRTPQGQIKVVFHKMVFCGTAPVGLCNDFSKSPGDMLGYLVVRLTAVVKGDAVEVPLGGSTTLFVVTPGGSVPIPFGEAQATGVRLR
jgi:hypothetical protein